MKNKFILVGEIKENFMNYEKGHKVYYTGMKKYYNGLYSWSSDINDAKLYSSSSSLNKIKSLYSDKYQNFKALEIKLTIL